MFFGLKLPVPSATLRSVRVVLTQAFVLLSLCNATYSIAASTFEPLDKAMTPDERVKSGTDSLTARQQFPNAWLQKNYMRNPARLASKTRAAAQSEYVNATPEAIEAKIDHRVAAKLADNRVNEQNKRSLPAC